MVRTLHAFRPSNMLTQDRSLDTLHLILITHSMYFYLISNFSNGKALQFTTW